MPEADRARMRDARGDNDDVREHLRWAESDLRERRPQMLAETRQTVIALRGGDGVKVRDVPGRSGALDEKLRRRFGVVMRRNLSDRDYNEGDRGNDTPSHRVHSRICFVS